MRITPLLLFLLSFQWVKAQRIDLDLFGGISNYQGDLQPIFFTLQNSNPGAASILKVGISDNVYFRAGFSFGSIAGYDSRNRGYLKERNLSFRSGIKEFSAGLEYRIIRPDRFKATPYFFLAAGVFRHNPYTYFGTNTTKVFLQPLSTEGQGLPEYPDRTPYQLLQFCIPYGGGVKWQINCNLNIGVEFRQTRVFSDYLDDVSTTYVDQATLLNRKGQLSVDLAWRGDEFDGTPYPDDGTKRGNPADDWFYFAGVTIGLKINDCKTGKFSLGGLFNSSARKMRQKSKCPQVW